MAIYTYADARTRPLYRGTQVVWYILGILEVLLAFRFVLRLLAANPTAAFTNFIYTISHPFVAPFMAVFNNTQTATGSAFEWTTLLAMVVYWIVAIAIVRLLLIGRPMSRTDAAYQLERQA